MNGGDTDTGGAKVNPNNTPSPTPQPDANSTSDTEAESVLTISHDDHPSMSEPQLTPQSTTPEPVVPPISPAQSISSPASAVSTQPKTNDISTIPTASTPQPAVPATPPANQPITPNIASAAPFANPTSPTLPTQAPQPAQSPQPLTSSIFPPQQPAQFPTQQPMSIGSGDVILGTSTHKKSKKGLIIGIISILAAIAVGVSISIFFVFRGDSQKINNSPEAINTLYNTYANFLLYGKEQSSTISDDVLWQNQSIVFDIIRSSSLEKKEEYVNTLLKLYKEFSETFSTVDIVSKYGDNGNLAKSLYDSLNTSVESLSKYILSGDLSADDIAKAYLNFGPDYTLSLVESTYGKIDSGEENAFNRFVLAKEAEANQIVNLFNYYLEIGCINNNTLDSQCLEGHSEDNNLATIRNNTEASIQQSEILSNHLSADVISSSSELYSILNEEDN